MIARTLEPRDEFKKFVMVSLAMHLALGVGVLIDKLFSSSDVIVIPNAIRVDMVALPDKRPEIQPVVEAPPKPTPAPPAPPVERKEAPKKVDLKSDQKKALEKLKAQNAIEKMRQDIAKKEAATPAPAPAAAQLYKGNEIQTGDSFTGLSKLRFNSYLSLVKMKIRENWALPKWLSDLPLKAEVAVIINGQGLVTRKDIFVSSGNSVFDSSCLAAIEASMPFEPPPGEVNGELIVIRFPFQ